MKKTALNLEDIAAKAGVSRATVSRVVNNYPFVKEKTRAHVLQVIEREGYNPNLAARALVTQRTQIVGVIIPQLFSTFFEDQYYFPTLLHGIAQTTNARDYATLLWIEDMTAPERFYDRLIRHRLMDGLILASFSITNPFLKQLSSLQIPVVLIEKPAQFFEQRSYVTIDNVGAAMIAVQHLLSLGRRRVATLMGDQFNPDGIDRLKGYQIAMTQSSFGYDPRLVAGGAFSKQSGYTGMKALLDQGVDAVFAANDQIALGALKAVQEAGLRCPDDISIVGFDDLPAAESSVPALTTVRQPVQERGAAATAMLLDEIEGLSEGGKHIVLPTELIIRESCGAATPQQLTMTKG